MSTRRKQPPNPKYKPLPKAPSKALPSAPSKPNYIHTKPRSNTTTTSTYTFHSNLNGSYTTNPSTNVTGYTYTTTYYTTSVHPWTQQSSKPLQKLPTKLKTHTPPVTSTNTYNPYKMSNNNKTRTRTTRATTLDTLQTITQKHQKRQPSYHNALPLAPTIVNLNIEYCINDYVDLNDNRQGIIRFIGEIAVELNGAIWYGIELKKPQGNCNGTLKGVSYFKCGNNYATFVEKNSIRWLTSSTENEVVDLESTSRLHINEIVGIKRKRGKGQIRFIGLFGNDVKYGIELLDDMGVHSGVVDGKFYFTCGIYRGIFVNRRDLIHLDHYSNDDTETLHNRSTNNIFTNLPAFNDRNGDCDSDGSIESDCESIASTSTLMTVDDDVFERIQLDERETDMAFTQILNKFKNVERTQPRPSKLDMVIDTSKLFPNDILPLDPGDDTPPKNISNLALDLSETSVVDEGKGISQISPQFSNTEHIDNDAFAGVACEIDAGDIFVHESPINNTDIDIHDKPKKMSIIVGMHNHDEKENGFKLLDSIPDPLLENINENEQTQTTETENEEQNDDMKMDMKMEKDLLRSPEIPTMIATETSNEKDSPMLTSLSPFGITPNKNGFHSPQLSLNLDEDLHFNVEDSHLKEIPDSPYDVNTNEREFANTANVIQLGCDHPAKLFKILKVMTTKLFQEDMKYRVLSAKSNRIRQKLLNYDGVEEFLNQLGFRDKKNGAKLECPLDQPPLSVLDAAINVCSDYIKKCSRRRAVIDAIKRFNPKTLNMEYEDKLEQKSETPLPITTTTITSIGQSPLLTAINTPMLNRQPSAAEVEQIAIDNTLKLIEDGGDGDGDEKENIIIEEELEDEEDTFKLFDIIASITHEENSDNSARQIILLCYTTFTDSTQMFNCLDKRFFTHPIKWHVQTKVIAFFQSWMRQYWDEDWANPISSLMDYMETFCDKLKEIYNQNEKKLIRYLKLVEMLEKTITFQKVSVRNESISQSPSSQYSVSQILNMPSISGSDDCEQQFDNKGYDFFKLNNIKIARQITFLDQAYFGMITARECLGQAWKKKNKYDIAYNICQFIDHFNRISKWVQTRVLLAHDAKKRGRTIKKFIKICEQLFILRNFQSLYAIYGALHSSAIIRLKKAWHYVPTKHLAKFEEFKVIFATKRNMANLRKLHRETYPPMIPYMGIFLQDLLSIEEGNSKRNVDGAVNFARLLRLSTVIDSILLFQKTKYKINLDKKLQQLIKIELSKNQNLNDEYVWKLSDRVKKIDSKKTNFMKFGGK